MQGYLQGSFQSEVYRPRGSRGVAGQVVCGCCTGPQDHSLDLGTASLHLQKP